MHKYLRVILCLITVLCPSITSAYTLSFDDVPNDSSLDYYYSLYSIDFNGGFTMVDQSELSWIHPNSGTKVVTTNSDFSIGGRILFAEFSPDYYFPKYMSSFSAYFSSLPGAVIKVSGYRSNDNGAATLINSMIIGSKNESWDNVYKEIHFDSGVDIIDFDAIDPQYAHQNVFAMDDLTITPVPEPSSLAALGFGLLPFVGFAMRRNKKH